MPKFKSIIGKRFGRLVVLSIYDRIRVGSKKECRIRYLCQCDCGSKKITVPKSLKCGDTISCGCRMKEPRYIIHGMCHTREYVVWSDMKRRCLNPNIKNYHLYGGRGIAVCKRWNKFTNFFKDMGKRPTTKHSLERRNNNKGYSPANCYWATDYEQSRNKRTNVRYEMDGVSMILTDWAKKFNTHISTFKHRLKINSNNLHVVKTKYYEHNNQ
jgi:hypothetical protein